MSQHSHKKRVSPGFRGTYSTSARLGAVLSWPQRTQRSQRGRAATEFDHSNLDGLIRPNARSEETATRFSSVVSVASCSKTNAREPEVIRLGQQEQTEGGRAFYSDPNRRLKSLSEMKDFPTGNPPCPSDDADLVSVRGRRFCVDRSVFRSGASRFGRREELLCRSQLR
jgi:hypothetical protein